VKLGKNYIYVDKIAIAFKNGKIVFEFVDASNK